MVGHDEAIRGVAVSHFGIGAGYGTVCKDKVYLVVCIGRKPIHSFYHLLASHTPHVPCLEFVCGQIRVHVGASGHIEICREELNQVCAIELSQFGHLFLDHLGLFDTHSLLSMIEMGVGVDETCSCNLVGKERPCGYTIAYGIGGLGRHVRGLCGPVVPALLQQEAAGLVQDGGILTLLGTIISGTSHHGITGYSGQDTNQLGFHSLLNAYQVGRDAIQIIVYSQNTIVPGVLAITLAWLDISVWNVVSHDTQLLRGSYSLQGCCKHTGQNHREYYEILLHKHFAIYIYI